MERAAAAVGGGTVPDLFLTATYLTLIKLVGQHSRPILLPYTEKDPDPPDRIILDSCALYQPLTDSIASLSRVHSLEAPHTVQLHPRQPRQRH